MKELYGDIFEQDCDAICITTNGFVTTTGNGVMGRGIAKRIADMVPELPKILGQSLRAVGNHTMPLVQIQDDNNHPVTILAFPTKPEAVHNDGTNVISQAQGKYSFGQYVPGFHAKSQLELIRRSAIELVNMVNKTNWNAVLLPRPGCGNGELTWPQVKAVIEPILDDRFIVMTYEG